MPANTSKKQSPRSDPASTPRLRPKKSAASTKVIHPKARITFRHNILPPLLGILIMLGVLGLLNGQWIVAQVQYRFIKPVPISSLSLNPTSADPNAPAQLIIPGINVVAPIITDEKTYNAGRVQLALRRGVVQYGNSANPGQVGNIIIVGHSSGQLWAPGNYKFVFTLLNKLALNDRILVDFQAKRYSYRVTNIKVVLPTDLSVLQPSDKPQLTLVTCTPVGTSKNRLVVTARQITPNPDTATIIDANSNRPTTSLQLPSN